MQSLIKMLLASLLLGLGGCSRSSELDPLLIGDWVWAGSSGGFAGASFKPKPTERIILTFQSNKQFSLYRNDTLLYGGIFSINTVRSIYSGKDEPQIVTQQVMINDQVKNNQPVTIRGVISTLTNEQLSIGDNAYDGFGSSFTRRK